MIAGVILTIEGCGWRVRPHGEGETSTCMRTYRRGTRHTGTGNTGLIEKQGRQSPPVKVLTIQQLSVYQTLFIRSEALFECSCP